MAEETITTNPVEGETGPAPATAGDAAQESQNSAQPTFTQEQVNGLVTKESRKQMEKLLQEVGLPADGDFKTQMKAFKEWQDSQKSDAEKSAAALLEAQKSVETERQKVSAMENRFLAVGKGIPANLAGKYVNLAKEYQSENENIDFSAALDLALKDFPIKSVIPVAVAPANAEGEPLGDEFQKRLAKYKTKRS